MSSSPTQSEWSEMVAQLSVDALVTKGLLRKEDFQDAVEIVAEEILVRLCLGDVPPAESATSG